MGQYKAIMLDVDGTLSNYSKTEFPLMPTSPVIKAIKEAEQLVYVGIATSRPLVKMRPILEILNLNCYSILHNGAQIIDPSTFKTEWMKPISSEALQKLYKIVENHGIQAYFSNFESNIPITSLEQVSSGPVADVFFDGVDIVISKVVEIELKEIPDIAIHQLSSRWENKLEISITHIEATKQSAVTEVAKLLNICTDKIIGVGDARNDILLLKACGFKIAMGNAVDELKTIADFIAPSVDEDGVKAVIDKFILFKPTDVAEQKDLR